MALVKWNPNRELLDMEKEFNKLWKSFGKRFGLRNDDNGESGYENAVWMPLSDISENDDNYVINLDLPGVKKGEVKINYTDGELTISGERKQEKEEKKSTYHRVERSYGKYFRSFNIPKKVDEDKIEAEFKDGQLTIVIPKAEESKPKQIEVKVK